MLPPAAVAAAASARVYLLSMSNVCLNAASVNEYCPSGWQAAAATVQCTIKTRRNF